MHELTQSLHEFCLQQGLEKTYWIAYSGGVDSHVLLHLFVILRKQLPIRLRAIHINHQLNPAAINWVKHCEHICRELNVDLITQTISIQKKNGDSLEKIARKERYDAIASHISCNDILLTAHHQDDQAETLLLQLARGAGIKGLSAMPKIKSFAQGLHARPLLNLTREALVNFATENHLSWIEDDSNHQVLFTRNFIRHDILSRLKSRWPTVTKTLSRSVMHFAETQDLLNEFASELFVQVQGSKSNTLSLAKLLLLSDAKQKLILRYWIQKNNYPLPSAKKLMTVLQTVFTANNDKNPRVSWGDVEVRRYRDDLYLIQTATQNDTTQTYVWQLTTPLILSTQTLTAESKIGCGLRDDIKSVIVRFRQGGESLQLNQHARITLKHFFQSKGIPTWERANLPLIFLNEALICIPGLFIDARYAAKDNEKGLEIIATLS